MDDGQDIFSKDNRRMFSFSKHNITPYCEKYDKLFSSPRCHLREDSILCKVSLVEDAGRLVDI
jgi:hypothetical protein